MQYNYLDTIFFDDFCVNINTQQQGTNFIISLGTMGCWHDHKISLFFEPQTPILIIFLLKAYIFS